MNSVPVFKVDTPARMLFFCTVRITGESDDDLTFYTEGTGFIYNASRTPGVTAAALVTARHVIEGATKLSVRFLLRSPDGNPDLGRYEDMNIAVGAAAFTNHPNPQIDVSVFPIELPLAVMTMAGLAPFGVGFTGENCPSAAELEQIDAIEDVTFVGYPNGLYDSANHTPIARRGVTATPIQLDWHGAPAFLIDAAVFPGSSGSPVVILRPAAVPTQLGLAFPGPRLIFLGVLTSVYEVPADVEGAGMKPGGSVQIGMGLGMVLKWTAVEETLDAMFAAAGVDRAAIEPAKFTIQVPPQASTTD